jgi:hypothetical protein
MLIHNTLEDTSRKHGKKNCTHLSIAVLLTTLICSHQTTAIFSIFFYDYNFKILGACNTPLERYFQYLCSSIAKAPKLLKLQLVNKKNKFVVIDECKSRWSKDPQWTDNCDSFLPCFLLVKNISACSWDSCRTKAKTLHTNTCLSVNSAKMIRDTVILKSDGMNNAS